jgi:hypothetical protein
MTTTDIPTVGVAELEAFVGQAFVGQAVVDMGAAISGLLLYIGSLGETHQAALDPDAAGKAWELALDILKGLKHPDASQVRHRLNSLDLADVPQAGGQATRLDPTLRNHTGHKQREDMKMTCARDGQRWRFKYRHRTVLVPHSVGMLHIAVLLANPDREIPAIELTTGVAALHNAATSTTRQPVLDHDAIRDYRNRIGQLREQFDQFEAGNQPRRAAEARVELDWLIGELAAATGISGRTRRFSDNPERARSAVSRAVGRALTRIGQADPHFGEHLRSRIHAGIRCSYRPTEADS